MKAVDWKFKKFLPDFEDVTASVNACEAYFKLCGIETEDVSCFHAGFNRGAAWVLDKYNVSELMEIIREIEDPYPCRFDHHGTCQEHCHGEQKLCIQERIKQLKENDFLGEIETKS